MGDRMGVGSESEHVMDGSNGHASERGRPMKKDEECERDGAMRGRNALGRRRVVIV